MKRMPLLILTVLVYVLPCNAQQWVGIKTANLQPFAVSQWKNEWCWAASSQLVLNYYGIPVTQDAIVLRSHGNEDDRPGSDMDITFTLNGWAPGPTGVRIVHATEFPGMLSPQLLYNNLSSGHPVIVAIATGPSSGHVVVITAAFFVPTPGGYVVPSIVLRDPWPSPDHIASIGRVQLDGPAATNFASIVRASWVTWVTPQ
jgi:hypothetical protein